MSHSETPALDAADARKAAILATIPEAAHAAVKQEAWYQQSQRGGRYSDHLAEAAANYRDGQPFGSPLAQELVSQEEKDDNDDETQRRQAAFERSDPDGYDRNGAFDGFQVTSDADSGL